MVVWTKVLGCHPRDCGFESRQGFMSFGSFALRKAKEFLSELMSESFYSFICLSISTVNFILISVSVIYMNLS